ncbi:MAG: RluA family pseudouridine synthase [Fusobacteriaceae bacterium]|nr:RluA family pseudouridine synthase [Fusobacteriaceae bacterium]
MDSVKEETQLTAREGDKGKRLDRFLQERLEGHTRSAAEKLIERGAVMVDGIPAAKNGLKLRGTESVTVYLPEATPLSAEAEDIPLDIVYEDGDLAVINKSAGVVVHPAVGNTAGTLVNGVLYHIKDLSGINGVLRPGIVHRLDKDTSGLIIVAKTDRCHVALARMFSEKKIKKTYIAIAKGIFKEKSGTVTTLIGRDPRNRKRMAVVEKNGKPAVTHYRVLDESRNRTLLALGLETGRTHQIRVHMKYLNHPLVGDPLYGNGEDEIKRQMLHAYGLAFSHPVTARPLRFTGAPPADFLDCVGRSGLSAEKIPAPEGI